MEYIGLLDPLYSNEGEKITLLCGSDATLADRAKILYSDAGIYKPITAWTRNGQTFKIEELLLNSLCSNYRIGYNTLSGMVLKNSFNQLNVITDSYTDPAKFMVKSMMVSYRDNRVECSLVQITPDELTIEK